MAKATKLPNIHPGEVLEEEFLKVLEMSRYKLAKELRVPVTRITEICQGRRSVSADTALRLAKFFGTTPKFWLSLQEDFDLEEQSRSKARELAEIKPLRRGGLADPSHLSPA